MHKVLRKTASHYHNISDKCSQLFPVEEVHVSPITVWNVLLIAQTDTAGITQVVSGVKVLIIDVCDRSSKFVTNM